MVCFDYKFVIGAALVIQNSFRLAVKEQDGFGFSFKFKFYNLYILAFIAIYG